MTDNTVNSEIQKDNNSNLEVGAKGGAIAFGLKISNTVSGQCMERPKMLILLLVLWRDYGF